MYDLQNTIFHHNLKTKVEIVFLLLHGLEVSLASLQGHILILPEQLLVVLRRLDNLGLRDLHPLLLGRQPTLEVDQRASMLVMSAVYLQS